LGSKPKEAKDSIKATDISEVLNEVEHLAKDEIVLVNDAGTGLVWDILRLIRYPSAFEIVGCEILDHHSERVGHDLVLLLNYLLGNQGGLLLVNVVE